MYSYSNIYKAINDIQSLDYQINLEENPVKIKYLKEEMKSKKEDLEKEKPIITSKNTDILFLNSLEKNDSYDEQVSRFAHEFLVNKVDGYEREYNKFLGIILAY